MFFKIYSADRWRRSLIRLRLVVLADLEVSQLVSLLVRSHHSQPVTEVVFLQVLLGEVLQIPGTQGYCLITSRRTVLPMLNSSHLLESCFSDVTLILFFMRPTWTMLPRFPVLPLTLILSLRKVSYWTDKSDVLGKRALVQTQLYTWPKTTSIPN